MEFGVLTNGTTVQEVSQDNNFPFPRMELISTLENEAAINDTITVNGGGKIVVESENWIKFSRVIIGENSQEGLKMRTLSTISEKDVEKLEEIIPPGSYEILDYGIPPELIKPITTASVEN